jgi:hypothetical protein
MPPKVSSEMKEALRLVESGMTGRGAAKQAGVREESLYRNAEYKRMRHEIITKESKCKKPL